MKELSITLQGLSTDFHFFTHQEDAIASECIIIGGFSFNLNSLSSTIGTKLWNFLEVHNFSAFFIGKEDSRILPIIYSSICNVPISIYLPSNCTACPVESLLVNDTPFHRLISRRYYLSQCCKDAQVIGLVAGTLSTSNYLQSLIQYRDMITAAGKKCVVISVGKLTIAKLGNFTEIDCFVWLTCPLSALLADERSFMKPVITPFEMQVGLGLMEWSGRLIFDYQGLVRFAEVPILAMDYSSGSHQLIAQDDRKELQIPNDVIHSTLVERMKARSFKGLSTEKSDDVAIVKSGWSGIARHYDK